MLYLIRYICLVIILLFIFFIINFIVAIIAEKRFNKLTKREIDFIRNNLDNRIHPDCFYKNYKAIFNKEHEILIYFGYSSLYDKKICSYCKK